MVSNIHFSPTELTGRSRGHIVDLAVPPCSLHHAVVEPFLGMRTAALADGIDLVPLSSFRDFDRQLAIWNGKHRGERALLAADGSELQAARLDDRGRVEAILIWSALPGASRHHWGTDLDVIDANAVPAGYRPQLVASEFAPGGIFARLDDWLSRNAATHGFFRPYTTWRGGVQPEPWHLSHAPVAAVAMNALSLDVLRASLADADMDAAEVVRQMLPDIFDRYVRNVDATPPGAVTSGTRLA